jgi:hypothetical protein
MKKIDFKNELQPLYLPPANEVVRVDVPTMNYLMLDGSGDPNTSQAFKDAVEVLFLLSYTLKFMVKKGVLAIDYGVLPLEGLWWADDMNAFSVGDKSGWKWTVMIMQPEIITGELVAIAIDNVRKKKNYGAALVEVRYEALAEGLCAQIMHIGPFSDEGPNIERVHAYIKASGCERMGKHHEIYLSDIRKADPAKWKTIIRQPMEQLQDKPVT